VWARDGAQVRGVSPCCTMKAVLGFLELYLHDAPDDDDDSLSIDAASYSSRTTTSTSGACGANDSPNTSAGGGVTGGGVHGPGRDSLIQRRRKLF